MTVQERLERALAAGRLSHAYLLVGGEAEEKLRTVRQIAAALNCAHREGGRACGRCLSCRQLEAGCHPDYHFIEPRGASIKIDQVRKLEGELRLKAFQGGAQVVVFHPAESLTLEAANCLLKIMEEPPGGVYFFLLAAQPALLLPTIVSRCQVLSCGGEQRGEAGVRSLWEEVLASDLGRLMTSVLPRLEKEEDVLSAVDGLMVACREQLVWQLTGEEGLLLEAGRIPAHLVGISLPPAALWRCYRHLRRTRTFLEQNANRHLALEVLLLNLHREVHSL
ncbi:MAG: hypothetical protein IMW96_04440 [Thermoanaerobacteraceae bacterium]|nr:hypothetical protein [Thermoanaerobacteraceae bacterium]